MSSAHVPTEEIPDMCRAAAAGTDRAAAHVRTACGHFRDKEWPRWAAHAWVPEGEVRAAVVILKRRSKTHARYSTP